LQEQNPSDMTDLAECTWQTLDTTDQLCAADSVIYAYFPGDVAHQKVQWMKGTGRYIVQPYCN